MKKTNKIILTALFPLLACLSSCGNLSSLLDEQNTNDSGNNTFEDFDVPDTNIDDNKETPKKDNDNKPQEKPKEDVKEEEPPKPKEVIVRDYDPEVTGNYHTGFDKRIYSSLFPYEPKVRQVLPKLNITTPNGKNDFATMWLYSMDQIYSAKKDGTIKYNECTFSLSNCEDDFAFDNIEGQVKLRGNASCYADKKSMSIKFNEKRGLLGLNNNKKFKKYVLDPLYYDITFQKESTALYLGKQMFNYDGIFSSDTTPVLLYLNNEYWGIYLLKERVQVNKNRINVDDIEKREPVGAYAGIDTGYVFEYDGYGILEEKYGINPMFRISYNNNAPLKNIDQETTYQAANSYMHPTSMINEFTLKSDIYSQDQLDFLSSYVGNVYKIVYEAVYNNKLYVFNSDYSDIVEVNNLTARQIIDKVININSFVDMYLLQEMCCNNDMYWGSQYFQLDMSKSGNKKLTFCSAWDYDWGFGRAEYMNCVDTLGKDVNTLYAAKQKGYGSTNAWYLLLIHQDWFWDLVKEKWKLLVDNGVLYNALHYIDEFTFVYANYYEENYEKWPFDFYNIHNKEAIALGNDFILQSDYLFKWLGGKFNYLNTVFGDGSKLFNF